MIAKILRGIAVAILIFALSLGLYYLDHTEVPAYVPVLRASAIALIAVILPQNIRRKITGLRRPVVSCVVIFAAVGILSFSGLLALNYHAASDTPHQVRAEIIDKNVRTEYATRRVGRGRYVRDTSRKIHHYEYTLRLPDGKTIKRHTDAGGYTRLRCGSYQTATLRRGYLGWTIIR